MLSKSISISNILYAVNCKSVRIYCIHRKTGECATTLTRVEADITSLLGMEAPTELCYQKCRRMSQASSHDQAGIQGTGGGATTMMGWSYCAAPVRPGTE